MPKFKVVSNFQPTGDQPQAIKSLVNGLNNNVRFQTLLGITGSGKTYTMAKVIEKIQKPTLILSHNKTLAAQLYGEFKSFFPNNSVNYFVSYYDYYQPEAYMPVSDTYIEKDADINEEIEKLRLKTTSSLLARKDVIIVASVSCIFGLGSPDDYKEQIIVLKKGEKYSRKELFKKFIFIHYLRNDISFTRGNFRVRGNSVEIFPAYSDNAIRLEFWGDELDNISEINPLTGDVIENLDYTAIYPARHFITNKDKLERSIKNILEEMKERATELRKSDKLLEAQRIEQRVNYDMEMIREIGYCSGIENYSRHLTFRKAGERPFTLFNYFPDDFMIFVDESHATIPQTRAMYNGDRARKSVLIEYGFRLKSAFDNRPLKFDEFEDSLKNTVFVSATPADYEIEKSDGVIVEQLIRPTGLLDPKIIHRPSDNQVDDLLEEIRLRVKKKERVLVTTLTKKMAEDLSDYFKNLRIKVHYLHSEINTLERISILRDLRLGIYDVIVGINLLREGLDLPEVSLVAILDADKEGFLRSERSLFQVSGRASRNVNGKVIFYANKITKSMKTVMAETNRRRMIQQKYNKEHGIKPKTIYKSLDDIKNSTLIADINGKYSTKNEDKYKEEYKHKSKLEIINLIDELMIEMKGSAEKLQFETAAKIRDRIKILKKELKK
ncbi:MAG: excinuclease ABC subunit UvrB [Candidatus Marinimicrobia bacterium]|jgi:excinuclease ABC subunit B|nr:excinuclease ABC subunit UvrB [Candidatus Neomarinimicrobiota bacterium]